MAAFLRKNFARGSLKNLLPAAALQMTLDVGHTLPTEAGTFRAVIWDMETFPNPVDDPDTEIVTATYSAPNVYTIVRAQEDTLQVAHAVGSEVALHYTAGMSSQDMDYLGTKLVDETGIVDDMVPVVSGSSLIYRKILTYDADLESLLTTI